jgi:hypothetical protein
MGEKSYYQTACQKKGVGKPASEQVHSLRGTPPSSFPTEDAEACKPVDLLMPRLRPQPRHRRAPQPERPPVGFIGCSVDWKMQRRRGKLEFLLFPLRLRVSLFSSNPCRAEAQGFKPDRLLGACRTCRNQKLRSNFWFRDIQTGCRRSPINS